MANTMLQVKRSATTAIPGSLSNGELAYSGNATSNSLFIGHPDGYTGVIRIAGGKYPYLHQASVGTVTANAVVILDANGYTANVRSSGLFVSSSITSPVANATAALITSISPQSNSTQLGAAAGGSNTELVTSYAIKTYVYAQISVGAVNTQGEVEFYSNNDNKRLTFFAPGTSKIIYPGGSSGYGVGTSVSTQIAAAYFVALTQSKPNLSYQQYLSMLISTSSPVKSNGVVVNKLINLRVAIGG